MKIRKKKPSRDWPWLKEIDSDLCWKRMRLRTKTPVRLARYGHIIVYYRRYGRIHSLWYPEYYEGAVFTEEIRGGEWFTEEVDEHEVFAWRYIIRKDGRRKCHPGGNWGGDPFFRSRKRWKKRDQDRERRYLKRGLNPPINLPF